MPSDFRSHRRASGPACNDAAEQAADGSGPWRQRLTNVVARLALQIQPALPQRLVSGHVPMGGFQTFALRSLLASHRPGMSEDSLSALHRAWWCSRAALEYHRHRMSAAHDDHDELLEPLRRAMDEAGTRSLCEIGCGNGRMLQRIAMRAPQLQQLIGLDLSLDQILVNRRQPRDPRIHYRAADVLDWLPTNGVADWAFVCFGGVLAYFSQREVAALFQRIAAQSSAILAFAEPLADDLRVDQPGASRISAGGRLLSHPYVPLLSGAGLQVTWSRETRVHGQRWLMLLARRRRLTQA